MRSFYNIYTLLRIYKKIKNHRIKALGLIVSSWFGMRHLSLRIDPVLACNLACQMCYFSNKKKRKQLKGSLDNDDIDDVSKMFFPRAFQLVVGCGAEPTLNKNFMRLLVNGKKYNVPNISIVTNGQLLHQDHIEEMIKLGVDEIIISAHGLTKVTYERFMVGGDFRKFTNLLNLVNELKKQYNSDKPQIRINYTVNRDNIEDLNLFKEFSNNYDFQIFQLRPIMDIGGVYKHLFTSEEKEEYYRVLEEVKKECFKKNITLLANTQDISYEQKDEGSYVIEGVYTYISSDIKKKYGNEIFKKSLKKYKKVTNWYGNLWKGIFGNHKNESRADDFLKYDIQ